MSKGPVAGGRWGILCTGLDMYAVSSVRLGGVEGCNGVQGWLWGAICGCWSGKGLFHPGVRRVGESVKEGRDQKERGEVGIGVGEEQEKEGEEEE